MRRPETAERLDQLREHHRRTLGWLRDVAKVRLVLFENGWAPEALRDEPLRELVGTEDTVGASLEWWRADQCVFRRKAGNQVLRGFAATASGCDSICIAKGREH